jgi:hypothetical protein
MRQIMTRKEIEDATIRGITVFENWARIHTDAGVISVLNIPHVGDFHKWFAAQDSLVCEMDQTTYKKLNPPQQVTDTEVMVILKKRVEMHAAGVL